LEATSSIRRSRGVAVTYDANGNTNAYDADGDGPILPRA
jgi:hypothetical protein